MSRIERDSEGNTVRLRLDGMRFNSEDSRSLGRLTAIRLLSLRGTNVTDADLRQLQALKQLEYLILTSTELTDAAVGEITKLESRWTNCLGHVAVTFDAIARLQEQFHGQGRRPEVDVVRLAMFEKVTLEITR